MLEKLIAAFRDDPNGPRMEEGIRHFFMRVNNQNWFNEFNSAMIKFCIPCLLRMIEQNKHPDIPVDVLVDELIDFVSLLFTQNGRLENGVFVISFPASSFPTDHLPENIRETFLLF